MNNNHQNWTQGYIDFGIQAKQKWITTGLEAIAMGPQTEKNQTAIKQKAITIRSQTRRNLKPELDPRV